MSNVPMTRPIFFTRPPSQSLKTDVSCRLRVQSSPLLMMEASPGLIRFRIPVPLEIKSVGAVPL